MITKDDRFDADDAAPGTPGARLLVALMLRAASRALDGLAERLALPADMPATSPLVEFHAEAGAPEGALYLDGRYVAHLHGVTRL